MTLKSSPQKLVDPELCKVSDHQYELINPHMSLSLSTDRNIFGGDAKTGTYIPGVYTFEVRAWNID